VRTLEGEELESRQQHSFLALSLGALCLPARADAVRDAAPAWWPGRAGDPRD
jgi:hypothetical protein